MATALERDLRAVYGAYEYLRVHDLTDVSTTSRLLREADVSFLVRRIRDEMDELRGAVAGTHRHGGGRDDIVLEAYQTLYWLIVLAVAVGARYDDVRPHEAIQATGAAAAQPWYAMDGLQAWRSADDPHGRVQALQSGFAALVRQCAMAGIPLAEAVQRDMAELRGKPYLEPYWLDYDATLR